MSGPDDPSDTSPVSSANKANYWKNQLLLLQENAPRPLAVECSRAVPNRPPYYGSEFHGLISREDTEYLLSSTGQGSYLVRESRRAPGAYTLCMMFDGVTRNYKLFYDGQHYVGEKRFENLVDLVADGMIHMHVQRHASEYISRMAEDTTYEESPYSQYQRKVSNVKRVHSRNPRSSSRGSNEDQASSDGSATSTVEQKSHQWNVHTWRAGAWCDFCANWMWGLIQQGVKCEDCGFSAHKRCSERVLPDCRPDLKYVKRMFGIDLVTLTMAYNSTVPPVISKCIHEIETRGLRAEGIYRIPGFHEEIEALRVVFDTKGDCNLASVEDINCIAGLLKLYFRLLPIPLITFSAYRAFIEILERNRSDSQKLKEIQRVIFELPTAHYCTLKLLMEHLSHVIQNSNSNRMTEENIARIFVPSLMRNPSALNSIALFSYEQYLVQFLISKREKIFSR